MFREGGDTRCRIVPPAEFLQIEFAIYGERTDVAAQGSWYALADVMDGDYIAIDCDPKRLGYCYDVFHETASQLNYCKVIALSFGEFLERMAEAGFKAWWLDKDFKGYGYANVVCSGGDGIS